MKTTHPPFDNLLYLLPAWKILFLQIPKCGCTTLARMMAEAGGKKPAAAASSALPERSRESLIHDPRIHRIPCWKDQRARMKKRALEESGWWRFALVRDPYARFFSAWLEKVFLRAPGTKHLWQMCTDTLDDGRLNITRTFAAFARLVAAKPEMLLQDWHFTPQSELISRFAIPSIERIPLSRLDDVARKLSAITGKEIRTSASNASLPIDYRMVYDAATADIVKSMYAADLGCDPAAIPPRQENGPDMLMSELETGMVMKLRDSAERIHDLSRLVVFPELVYQLQIRFGRRSGCGV